MGPQKPFDDTLLQRKPTAPSPGPASASASESARVTTPDMLTHKYPNGLPTPEASDEERVFGDEKGVVNGSGDEDAKMAGLLNKGKHAGKPMADDAGEVAC